MTKDYRELLSLFAKHRVRYLVVGGYAVMYHTEPRYTKDIDVWVDPTLANAKRVYQALSTYGAPLRSFTPADFTEPSSIFQIGVEPVRIDILMSVSGVRFDTAWNNRDTATLQGVRIHFISREDLIRAKKAAGRRRDLDDIDGLRGKS